MIRSAWNKRINMGSETMGFKPCATSFDDGMQFSPMNGIFRDPLFRRRLPTGRMRGGAMINHRMNRGEDMKPRIAWTMIMVMALLTACGAPENKEGTIMEGSSIAEQAITAARDSLLARHGEALHDRIDRGVRQVAALWREEDGTAADFQEFCLTQFIADPDLLHATFERLQRNFMLLGGYFTEMGRDLNAPLQLDQGPILPVDYLFGNFSPSAHLGEDLYRSRIAFTVLLNFPRSTLQQRLEQGSGWSRRQWAETRMADR